MVKAVVLRMAKLTRQSNVALGLAKRAQGRPARRREGNGSGASVAVNPLNATNDCEVVVFLQ